MRFVNETLERMEFVIMYLNVCFAVPSLAL
jgi:hypothetical protein